VTLLYKIGNIVMVGGQISHNCHSSYCTNTSATVIPVRCCLEEKIVREEKIKIIFAKFQKSCKKM